MANSFNEIKLISLQLTSLILSQDEDIFSMKTGCFKVDNLGIDKIAP
jgi:hypothetical protein